MSNSSPQSKTSPAEWAKSYAAIGWSVVPIPHRSKAPIVPGWQNPRVWPDSHFASQCNIGVLLGQPSGGLVDIDLDSPAAVALADKHLPPTLSFGRPGKPRSHRLYICDPLPATRKFKDAAGKMVVEFRSTGCQTVFPPSIHESGESIAFDSDIDPARIDGNALMQAVEALAVEAGAILPNLAGKVDQYAKPLEDRQQADAFKRCRLYLETIPDAISGNGGHAVTFRAASEIYRFGLTESEAWDMLSWFNSAKCQPAWTERELRHKLKQARASVDKEGRFAEKLNEGNYEQVESFSPRVSAQPGEIYIDPVANDARNFDATKSQPYQAKSFPAELLNPPGVVGEICRWMNATAYKPQPILSLANALAFFGAVVGRKVETPTGLRTNLYCLGVGESGCGKDHSRKAVKRICDAASLTGELLGGEEIASDSAILSAVAAHPSILFQLDEIGHMLSQANSKYAAAHMRNIAPTFMRLFSSANTVMIGKEYIGRDRADIDQPNACLYGTTVPGRLFGGMSPSEISDGFLGRMLVFISDDPDPDEEERPAGDVPESIRICVEEWQKRIDMPTPKSRWSKPWKFEPFTVPFNIEATGIIARFAAEAKANKAACRDGSGTDALWARAVEHARKVAITVAAGCDFAKPAVDAGIAAWSVKLVTHLTASLIEAVRDNITDSDYGRTVQKIMAAVSSGGSRGVTTSEITRRCQGIHKNARRDALDDLVSTGQVILATEKTKTKERRVFVDAKLMLNTSSNTSSLDLTHNSISSN